MKTGWKWVLGIIAVLVIVTFIGFGSMHFRYQMTGIRNDVSKFQSYHVNPPMHMDGQNFYFDNQRGYDAGIWICVSNDPPASILLPWIIPIGLVGLAGLWCLLCGNPKIWDGIFQGCGNRDRSIRKMMYQN